LRPHRKEKTPYDSKVDSGFGLCHHQESIVAGHMMPVVPAKWVHHFLFLRFSRPSSTNPSKTSLGIVLHVPASCCSLVPLFSDVEVLDFTTSHPKISPSAISVFSAFLPVYLTVISGMFLKLEDSDVTCIQAKLYFLSAAQLLADMEFNA